MKDVVKAVYLLSIRLDEHSVTFQQIQRLLSAYIPDKCTGIGYTQ